ncbi:MAG: hypothetical protein JO262_13650 [Solirubrobacterales bacterium]|nr:hypothetical protein [Solirubrobacterales bacterium]
MPNDSGNEVSSGQVPVPSSALGGPGVIPPGQKQRVALGEAGGGAPSFSDHGGVIIPQVHLYLIFWGAAWNSAGAVPTMGQVTDAVINILTGPYMASLHQYRGIDSGYLVGANLVSNAVGSSPASPPTNFTNNDVSNLLTNLISAGRLPDPSTDSELLYMVMLPPGVSQPGLLGEHTYYSHNGTNLHFGWVANGGSLTSVTWVFSHELVESVTDPEGTAVTGTGCNQGGWCEIGDVCTGNTAVINGVTVQRYWSQVDGQCVVPTDPIVKQDKDSKDAKDKEKDAKDHKDIKDKEHKPERKEIKDGKEKEPLDRPPIPPKSAESLPQIAQMLASLSEQVNVLASQVSALSGGVVDPMGGASSADAGASGAAFIASHERPPVGELALEESGV